jgi:anaerobic nitric oxide reductase transcription regulator
MESLIDIALDMTASLSAQERYQRLLGALKKVIPYDAAALFRIEDQTLIPAATMGLTPDAMGRRLRRGDHPRLDIICKADRPVRFPSDTPLPDPFDGLLSDADAVPGRIHSCLGCPLYADGVLIGVLTADAVDPDLFESLDLRFIEAVAALAGAQMRTIDLIEALEHKAHRMGLIAQDVMLEIHRARPGELIGSSPAMQHLRREIGLVAPSDFIVLVTGETGVGKELVVRAIHAASGRRDRCLLYLNCAAIPENLAESELFGHVRGAFTGAASDRAGKFELADGGTLFLDEIGELPLTVQPKLLRAIQQGEIQRVGGDRVRTVHVRLLAATNRDLAAEVAAGRFRADLFHRLNVYPLNVPALRERLGDIALLAGHFCEQLRRSMGLDAIRVHPSALARLSAYAWPGNVRELGNVLARAVLQAAGTIARGKTVTVGEEHLSLAPAAASAPQTENDGQPPVTAGMTLKAALDDYKRAVILQAVRRHYGNWAAAGRELGLHRSNLSKLADRLGIRKGGKGLKEANP